MPPIPPPCNARLKSKPNLRCKLPVIPGRKRCRFHGGKSTGPTSRAGLERMIEGRNQWLAKLREEGKKLPGRTKGARNRRIIAYEQAVLAYNELAEWDAHEQARQQAAQSAYNAALKRLRKECGRKADDLNLFVAQMEAARLYHNYPPRAGPPRREDFKSPPRYKRKPLADYPRTYTRHDAGPEGARTPAQAECRPIYSHTGLVGYERIDRAAEPVPPPAPISRAAARPATPAPVSKGNGWLYGEDG